MTTKRTQVGLHLDAAMIQRLKKASARLGQPMTVFMRDAIRMQLNREDWATKNAADSIDREAKAKAEVDARTAEAVRRVATGKGFRRVMIGSAARNGITYEQLKAEGMTDAEIINLGFMKILAC